jgi:uncharacterized membrane protein
MANAGSKLPLPLKIVLVDYALAMGFFVPALMEVKIPMILPYHWHKALHILGAVLFLGNVIITGGWLAAAQRSRSPAVLRFGLKMVFWADVFFTGPGFFLALSNGAILAQAWGGVYAWSWLVAAIVLLAITGTVAMIVMPLQLKLWRLADGPADDPIPEEVPRVIKQWGLWGSIATVLPLVILFIMVVKPRLWGDR